jgi:hypothetical protein
LRKKKTGYVNQGSFYLKTKIKDRNDSKAKRTSQIKTGNMEPGTGVYSSIYEYLLEMLCVKESTMTTQSALHIHRFLVCGFNQSKINNNLGKKASVLNMSRPFYSLSLFPI